MSEQLQQQYRTSFLSGGNAPYIESYYEQYLKDPDSVPPAWRAYFQQLNQGEQIKTRDVAHTPIRESFAHHALHQERGGRRLAQTLPPEDAQRQTAVLQLINAYRFRGHQQARLDPLGLWQRAPVPDLDPEFHGLSERDMDTVFNTGSLYAEERLPLRRILELLRGVYTETIGSEYMHITDTREKRWIQQRLEGSYGKRSFSEQERRRILMMLTAAEGIEKYLHTHYVGQKRFSLEGGDSFIPQLDDLVKQAVRYQIEEIVIGMAHRGRLNVLVNVLGKSPKDLFEEFEGRHDTKKGSGDVKYHMGFSSDVESEGKRLHLALAFNPSHLEIVDPVVLGSVRARQDRRIDTTGDHVLPVLIHGDASFVGQGVVMEILSMSQTRGFRVGGTVHIVINNQIGFTTSDPRDARSTEYCTDLAKMVQAPIFHVNADDPEAVVFVTRLALEYRMTFHKDVVVDLVCYRRHGHNEADEPAVTQPVMYRVIKNHPTPRAIYGQQLVQMGMLDEAEVAQVDEDYRKGLEQGRNIAREQIPMIGNQYTVDWSIYDGTSWDQRVETTIPVEYIRELADRMGQLPAGWELHPRVQRIMDDRRKMAAGALPIDWGFAETMAYASLLEDGYAVRLVGQDSGRGTFFHRHAVLHNQQDDARYIPLEHVSEQQGRFDVYDSLLSEEGVLGFEYGYATADPNVLVIWEAQFGDFANGAQVVIDQFISSGEAKWQRLCGLVMFLPHGYEGQGPEHSSARLERYLQLCAERNMQVCVPSTPGQMFHMLRRQMLRPYRKPLIVMTPKSLLRRRIAMSSLEVLADEEFHNVIDEIDELDRNRVRRVIVCAGKVYYDLLEKRREHQIEDIAIVRVEQLYPFAHAQFAQVLAGYGSATEVVWCQEEPKNQGAWFYVQHQIRKAMQPNQTLLYAGRHASASTAAGYHELHVRQQEALLQEALDLADQEQTQEYAELSTREKA